MEHIFELLYELFHDRLNSFGSWVVFIVMVLILGIAAEMMFGFLFG